MSAAGRPSLMARQSGGKCKPGTRAEPRALLGAGQAGQQQRGEDGDDRDHHQQLNQREAIASGQAHSLRRRKNCCEALGRAAADLAPLGRLAKRIGGLEDEAHRRSWV